MEQTQESCHLLVAAFDIGTTFSGYAFSWRDDPLKVQTNQGWNAGSEKLISLKAPTCVLLNNKKEFNSFGFEAENKYSTLAEENEHHGWMFFSRFKMLLHNNSTLSRTTVIDDINGNQMPAMTIFSMSIRFLREHFLKMLNNQTCGIEETEIQYVITVPAIWNDNAKQFMREVAVQAGIDTRRLTIALEPEAASIWCQTVKTEAKGALSGPGTKYMVVDLGGGTADISVHEKKNDGTLKELHKASGGPWGGIVVDQNYLKWLENVYGKQALLRLRKEDMADYIDLLREFETKKRLVASDSSDPLTFRISATLKEYSEEHTSQKLSERISLLNLNKYISIKKDKMRIHPSVVSSWFGYPINECMNKMKSILSEESMEGVFTILLVGGFAESKYVQETIKATFPSKRIVVPDEAGLTVLRGAVRFGHQKRLISSRIMKCTYGIRKKVRFDETVHSLSQKIYVNRKEYVDDVFDIFVKSGETIETGKEVTQSFMPTSLDKTGLEIYSSDKPDPKYTTDASCKLLGKLTIEHEGGDTLEEKSFNCTLVFWDTEISVKAMMRNSKDEYFTTFECLI